MNLINRIESIAYLFDTRLSSLFRIYSMGLEGGFCNVCLVGFVNVDVYLLWRGG